MVKRLIDQRQFVGRGRIPPSSQPKKKFASAESLVNAYRKESQKQKLLVRKAKVCDSRLLFVVTALSKLVSDDHFLTLLRAESLMTMPKFLKAKIGSKEKASE